MMQAIALIVVLGVLGLAGAAVFTRRVARRVEQVLPPLGRLIDLPGARLHVYERGPADAQPIVLIHGLGGQMRNYDYGMIAPLAERFRVIAIDRPGSGYSTRPHDASARLSAQADVVAALIAKLGLRQPLIVGHSLGGALSLALAEQHPDAVGALALIAPLTRLPGAPSPAFRALLVPSAWLRRLIAWTVATPLTIRRAPAVLDIVFGPEAVPADYGLRGGGLLNLRPSHFVASSTDIFAVGPSMAAIVAGYADLAKRDLAIDVLYGRGDRILDPVENGEQFVARVPHARLHLVDGGHMLPVTQPEATAAFVAEAAQRLAQTRPDAVARA